MVASNELSQRLLASLFVAAVVAFAPGCAAPEANDEGDANDDALSQGAPDSDAMAENETPEGEEAAGQTASAATAACSSASVSAPTYAGGNNLKSYVTITCPQNIGSFTLSLQKRSLEGGFGGWYTVATKNVTVSGRSVSRYSVTFSSDCGVSTTSGVAPIQFRVVARDSSPYLLRYSQPSRKYYEGYC